MSSKLPEEAARIVGEVDRHNYFAHSIRDIQKAIFQLKNGLRYHIYTHLTDVGRDTAIVFNRHFGGCDIILSYQHEDSKEADIRIALAHELGHLVREIDNLENMDGICDYSVEEEIFAWKFAFYLVREKSRIHKEDIERGKHIFTDTELRRSMSIALKGLKDPKVYETLKKDLVLP